MLDKRKPFFAGLLAAVVLVGGLVAGGATFAGQPGAEKAAAALVMPLGLTWVLLFALTVALVWGRRPGFACCSLLAFLSLSAAGNGRLADRAGESIEGAVAPIAAAGEEKTVLDFPQLDVLVLLGGGVGQYPNGVACGNDNSDRVLLAARGYHSGNVARVHCTGSRTEGLTRFDRDEAELSKELLVSLGVPEEQITLGSGRNTSEEFQALREELTGEPSIGVVTSAWHMPRVQRLATANGLTITPIPSDYLSGPAPGPGGRILEFIPSGDAADRITSVLRERLAGLVKR